jgi:hypothetical protein
VAMSVIMRMCVLRMSLAIMVMIMVEHCTGAATAGCTHGGLLK